MRIAAFIFTLLCLGSIFATPGLATVDTYTLANLTVASTYVPEPATVGLLVLGSIFFVFRKRN